MSENGEPSCSQASTSSSKDEDVEKAVKREQIKKEGQEMRRTLSCISPPRRRRILDRVMTRHHKDRFYKPLDIAKKILMKLKVDRTTYSMRKVRRDMDQWIAENDPDKKAEDLSSEDDVLPNRKLRARKEQAVIQPLNVEEATEKPTNTQTECDSDDESVIFELEKVATTAKVDVPPKVKTEEPIPVIDLTLEVKEEVKVEEIIQIDDEPTESSDKSTTANASATLPPLPPAIPYPVFGYNPYLPPEGYYQPGYYPAYPYNPYMVPYGYAQYPYDPSHGFYVGTYNSDLLPNYPVNGPANEESSGASQSKEGVAVEKEGKKQ